MKQIKTIIFLIPVMLLVVGLGSCQAQIKNPETAEVHIYGNCGMCKKTIERAGNKNGKSKVEWDKDSKIALITFNSKKTSLSKVLKKIANAGYDNEQYFAPDAVYEELHGCCQYERKPKTKENKK